MKVPFCLWAMEPAKCCFSKSSISHALRPAPEVKLQQLLLLVDMQSPAAVVKLHQLLLLVQLRSPASVVKLQQLLLAVEVQLPQAAAEAAESLQKKLSCLAESGATNPVVLWLPMARYCCFNHSYPM